MFQSHTRLCECDTGVDSYKVMLIYYTHNENQNAEFVQISLYIKLKVMCHLPLLKQIYLECAFFDSTHISAHKKIKKSKKSKQFLILYSISL